MKKLIFIITLLAFTFTSHAQVTITADSNCIKIEQSGSVTAVLFTKDLKFGYTSSIFYFTDKLANGGWEYTVRYADIGRYNSVNKGSAGFPAFGTMRDAIINFIKLGKLSVATNQDLGSGTGGSMTYPPAGIAVSDGSRWLASIDTTQLTIGDGLELTATGLNVASKIWFTVAGAYASTTTFTVTGTTSTANKMYGSLLRWESTGGVIRYGFIAKAVESGGTITATCYGTAAMAASDKNYYYAPNLKARLWERRITIPGELVTDASNPQGMWYQGNANDTLAIFDVSAWVLTAASGAGAACQFNLYHGTTALFSSAINLTTSTNSLDNVPTAVTLVPPSVNMTMRIISSAGATTKPANFQCRYFAVPTRLYWGL